MKVTANKVRDLESETSAKQGQLDPIQAKIDFIEDANTSGEQYWDRFHAINEYIPEFAQMTRFSITAPGSVNFTVIVGDTTEAARFVLNIVHCPALSNVSVSGLPAGMSIEGAGGATGGGGFQPMGGPEMGMDMGMEPGMEPGMEAMGPMGGMGGGAAPQASASGDITLDVSAALTESVGEPVPSGGAAAGGGGAPGMAGMGGPGMGAPGMEPGMEPG
ncbi:MAG: hypothetical protein GF393_10915, partial [Armatimonadia bacterium]|nr:hypothetical protein [Armatimonadia bacterium]